MSGKRDIDGGGSSKYDRMLTVSNMLHVARMEVEAVAGASKTPDDVGTLLYLLGMACIEAEMVAGIIPQEPAGPRPKLSA